MSWIPRLAWRRYGEQKWEINASLRTSSTSPGGWDRIPIRGCPLAFYQTGEKYMLVEADVFPTPPFNIRVTWSERGDERTTFTRISAKGDASTTFAGVPGTLLTVDDDHRGWADAFGDWDPDAPARIVTAVQYTQTQPWALMLRLLMSGNGNGFNHALYDTLPFGLNLSEDDVNVDSFEDFPLTGLLASGVSYEVDEARSVRDIFEPFLTAMNASLVLRLDPNTGLRKLTLTPAGVANVMEVAAVITDGDWAVDGRPASYSDDRLVNSLTFRLNYDYSTREHGLEVTVNDRDSIMAFQESSAATMDLRGVQILAGARSEQVAKMLPIAQQRFAVSSFPRRRIRGSIAWSDAVRLDAGSVVVATATDARGLDGTRGISSQPMRVVSLTRDADTQRADIVLEYHGVNATGWAPAMSVSAVVDADEVDVEANAHTDPQHFVTGADQTDVGFFAVNDPVVVIPHGDYGNRVSTTITAFPATNRVRFADPHGLAGGATIRPESWDSAASAHQAYAFLADSEGLGAAPDPAFEYT